MTPEQNADELKRLVHARTGLKPKELVCPHEKSEMTPCVARNGALAVTTGGANAGGRCAGCDRTVPGLLAKEQAKLSPES